MRTYCVFQLCDKHGNSRLVDRITASVQDGINMYVDRCRFGEVLFLPDHNEKKDMPDSLVFLEPEAITPADIEWLRKNQDYYKLPIKEAIQRYADEGHLGIYRGICVKVLHGEVIVKHLFLVELRHVYDDTIV
jgi:hypothetical protein